MAKLVIATVVFLAVPVLMEKECCRIDVPVNGTFREELKTRIGGYVYGSYRTRVNDTSVEVCTFSATSEIPQAKRKPPTTLAVRVVDRRGEEDFLHVGIYYSPRLGDMWRFSPINKTTYEDSKCEPPLRLRYS
ncbi:hypothetical protein GCK32_014419 [Trichostrongylus colubriformis]|uniref:Uncharacterized protein n=1 Tax=Trichostrongylus colubriformis TaxID=6319 RepID=A0AAN8ILZ0_TRICO